MWRRVFQEAACEDLPTDRFFRFFRFLIFSRVWSTLPLSGPQRLVKTLPQIGFLGFLSFFCFSRVWSTLPPSGPQRLVKTFQPKSLVFLCLLLLNEVCSKHVVLHNQEKPRLHSVPFCTCLLYTSPSPRDRQKSRMPSSA